MRSSLPGSLGLYHALLSISCARSRDTTGSTCFFGPMQEFMACGEKADKGEQEMADCIQYVSYPLGSGS
jgi:hypothetical protein